MRRIILLFMAMAMTLVVASGVAWAVTKVGTNGRDTLWGTNGADTLVGLRGNDRIYGLAGRDKLLGGLGKDLVMGGKRQSDGYLLVRGGNKHVNGGPGNDIVLGGTGSDHVVGGAGNDFLAQEGGKGNEFLSGGEGTDVILLARPAAGDKVTCGGGYDRVFADRKDVVAPNCERVVIDSGDPSYFRFRASVPQSFYEGLPPGIL